MKYLFLALFSFSIIIVNAQGELTQLRINELKKQKELVDNEIKQYDQQLQKLDDQIRAAESRRSALVADFNKKYEALNEEQAALEGYDLDQLNATIKRQESTIASNKKAIRKLQRKVEKNNKKIQKLTSQNEQFKIQIALIEQQNETALNEINGIREIIKDKNLNKKAKRLNKSQKALAKLNQQKTKINGEIDYYQRQKSEIELKREVAIQRLETINQTLKTEEGKLN